MAGSGFMILCFQSPPQARHKMGEANLGTPPRSKTFQKNSEANLGTPPQQSISRAATKSESWYPTTQPQSISKKTTRKAFQKNTTHRQKPHTEKSLQPLTNLHKKCSFSHINAYLCNNFYKNQQSYN